MTKQPRYWFDQEAVREPAEYGRKGWADAAGTLRRAGGDPERSKNGDATWKGTDPSAGRNVRSVWEIATQPYPEAHFATFPEELPRRAISAGCPLWVCRVCGRPRERIVDVSYEKSPVHGSGSVVGRHYETGANNYDGAGMPRLNKVTETTGWSDCGHNSYRPGVVLDPFAGAGTTLLVARKLGRHSVGIELNPEYAELIKRRTQQLSLLGDAA